MLSPDTSEAPPSECAACFFAEKENAPPRGSLAPNPSNLNTLCDKTSDYGYIVLSNETKACRASLFRRTHRSVSGSRRSCRHSRCLRRTGTNGGCRCLWTGTWSVPAGRFSPLEKAGNCCDNVGQSRHSLSQKKKKAEFNISFSARSHSRQFCSSVVPLS